MNNATTTETARLIRAAIKAAGFRADAVSVRSSETSMSATVTVRVLNPFISLAAIEAVALPFADVTPGLGGNLFVRVSYAAGVSAERTERLAALSDATSALVASEVA